MATRAIQRTHLTLRGEPALVSAITEFEERLEVLPTVDNGRLKELAPPIEELGEDSQTLLFSVCARTFFCLESALDLWDGLNAATGSDPE
jgi:hypothetical protein